MDLNLVEHRLSPKRPALLSCLTLAVLCCTVSCKRSASPVEALDNDARAYVRLAVALGERDKESLDYYYGPSELVADIHKNPPTYPEIKKSALALEDQIRALEVTDPIQKQRVDFLLRQLHAIAVRIDILTIGQQQNEMPFDRESEALLGIKAPATYDKEHLAQVRAEIDHLIGGTGSLATRYAAFDEKFAIPPKLIPAVMTRAIAACRQITATHIPLPAGESTTLEYTTNQPWSAFSRYHGDLHSVLQLNTDFVLTVDRALQLACHEGYPGHHVFNSTRDATLVRKTQWPELTVQTTFSPQSLISESAAVYATQLAFTDAERLEFERKELFPLAGLDPSQAEKYLHVERLVDQLHVVEPSIARGYLDGTLEYLHASEALENEALMAHTKATLLYLNEYRSYVLTYTYGVDLMQRYIEGPGPSKSSVEERWSRYHDLMTQPDIDITGNRAPTKSN